MQKLWLTLGLCLLGACSSDNSGGYDLSAAANDLGAVDLRVLDSGGLGATCTTACDCQPGLGCLNKVCTQGNVDIYCCTGSPCPAGAGCQATDQSYALCSGPDAGGNPSDLGTHARDMGASFCANVSCTAGDLTKCQAFGCSMCVGGPGGMTCAK